MTEERDQPSGSGTEKQEQKPPVEPPKRPAGFPTETESRGGKQPFETKDR
jgi:hypothetical protein